MNQAFLKALVKGRVAELIFEQMFREAGKFTILRMGAEYTLPQLVQIQRKLKLPSVLDDVRHTPDFLLISKDQTEAFFVEVKYRQMPQGNDLAENAAELLKRWSSPWLFLAYPGGFCFAPCRNIVREGGAVAPLSTRWVSGSLQASYLAVLQEFNLGS